MCKKIVGYEVLVLSGFILFSHSSLNAQDQKQDEETHQRIERLEERVRQLEDLLKKAGIKIDETTPQQGDDLKAKQQGQTQPEDKRGQDEWEELPTSQKQQGRDEEARRRLMELETWKLKAEGEKKKQEEEEAEKVKFEFSGKYKVRLNVRDNFNLSNPIQEWDFDDETYFDQRFQLQIDAVYGPLSTVLLLDKGNFVFDWKEDSEGTLDRWGEFFTVNAALVRELYAQYTGDFVAKVGRQNWDIGHSIVLEGPVDSIKLSYPLGQAFWGRMTVNTGYMAIAGGWRSYSEFLQTGPPAGTREDVFAAHNNLDGYYLGLDIRPTRDIKIEPYAIKVIDRGGNVDLNLDKDFNSDTTPRDGSFEPLWSGVSLMGKWDKVSLNAEAISLSGSYTDNRDVSAYAFLLEGNYDLGKAGFLQKPSIGLEFGLGSGNEAEDFGTETTIRDFSSLFLCRDRHKFGNIFSEDIRAGYFLWDSNLSNITYLQAHATAEPVKDLKTTLAITKIWTTEDVFKGRGPVPLIDWSSGSSSTLSKTNDVGWEIDLNLEFPIMKRLDGFINLGYFVPGDVYQLSDGSDADPASEFVLGTEFKF
jgi:hypothetical protein